MNITESLELLKYLDKRIDETEVDLDLESENYKERTRHIDGELPEGLVDAHIKRSEAIELVIKNLAELKVGLELIVFVKLEDYIEEWNLKRTSKIQ